MLWNPQVVAGIGAVTDPTKLHKDMHTYLAGTPMLLLSLYAQSDLTDSSHSCTSMEAVYIHWLNFLHSVVRSCCQQQFSVTYHLGSVF